MKYVNLNIASWNTLSHNLSLSHVGSLSTLKHHFENSHEPTPPHTWQNRHVITLVTYKIRKSIFKILPNPNGRILWLKCNHSRWILDHVRPLTFNIRNISPHLSLSLSNYTVKYLRIFYRNSPKDTQTQTLTSSSIGERERERERLKKIWFLNLIEIVI